MPYTDLGLERPDRDGNSGSMCRLDAVYVTKYHSLSHPRKFGQVKSDRQRDDRAGRGIGFPMRSPAGLPGLRSRNKLALFKRDGAERLSRGEVKYELLDRAFQTQAEGDDQDHER